ncbi:MAG: response regulator transcription factor [Bacteroidales bacterium]|nr:response regulator transcription factor [Bacteroidales bacterium]
MTDPGKTYRVLIADIQFLVTEAIRSVLSGHDKYIYAGQAENPYELTNILRKEDIDLLITDPVFFDDEDSGSLKFILSQYPELSVLILTHSLTRNEVNKLDKIGIKNILYKTTDQDELMSAIDAAVKKKKYYGGEVIDLLMTKENGTNHIKEPLTLTPAEIRIVELIAGGLTTKEIADKKCISFHTVMSHRKNIFRKLNINNASELVMYAVRAGWVDAIEYHI